MIISFVCSCVFIVRLLSVTNVKIHSDAVIIIWLHTHIT